MNVQIHKFKHPILRAWAEEGVCSFIWNYMENAACTGDEHPVEFIAIMSRVLAKAMAQMHGPNILVNAFERDLSRLAFMTMTKMKELEVQPHTCTRFNPEGRCTVCGEYP